MSSSRGLRHVLVLIAEEIEGQLNEYMMVVKYKIAKFTETAKPGERFLPRSCLPDTKNINSSLS